MPYEIVRRLGRGGMGVVDLAVDEQGRQVALKRVSLHGTPEELERARQRVKREAEALGRIDHPGVVALHEVLDDGDDVVLVMDYLPGGNLSQRVADAGPLPPDEVQRLADRLLDALAAAHRQGVVHRDIKPANVLFDGDGNAALADFGVARHHDATPGLTASEMVVGTPGFMSPEQARGEDATAASDVFSLGATLRFAATGSGPFGAADPRVLMLRAAAGKTERTPKTVPAPLRRRLDAMTARDPHDRPTAAAARGGTEGDASTRVGAAAGRRAPVRRWALVGAIFVAGATIGIAGAVALSDGDGGTAATTTLAPTTEPCTPLPYQECGRGPAPNTDGEVCDDGFADYDEEPTNGCEAAPDEVTDGATLEGEVTANLVPADDVDTYTLEVPDRFQLNCGGEVHVTLTAPTGVSQRVTVFDGEAELGTGVSGDGEPTTVTVREPNCFGDDTTTLSVRVESVGTDRSAEGYALSARGSF